MKLKANYNLVLPDGKTKIQVGEEFDFNGDISQFGTAVTVIGGENPNNEPATVEEVIRAKAKELKIANWYTKGVGRLIKEIEEVEAAAQDEEGKANAGE